MIDCIENTTLTVILIISTMHYSHTFNMLIVCFADVYQQITEGHFSAVFINMWFFSVSHSTPLAGISPTLCLL